MPSQEFKIVSDLPFGVLRIGLVLESDTGSLLPLRVKLDADVQSPASICLSFALNLDVVLVVPG